MSAKKTRVLFDVAGYSLFEAALTDAVLNSDDGELRDVAEDHLNLQEGALTGWSVHRANLDAGEPTVVIAAPGVR